MLKQKIFRKNSGISLIEVIVALAIIGVVSIPITMVFFHSMKVTKLSDNQIEINAVTRIVNRNVVEAIKGSAIQGTVTPSSTGTFLTTDKVNYSNATDIPVFDFDGKEYVNYRFDATYDGVIAGRSGLRRYKIVLKKKDPVTNNFDEVRRFAVEANNL